MVIATYTTQNGGQFYFRNSDVVDANLTWTGTGSDVEILPLTDYTTRISNATGGSQQTPLDGLSLTTLDANANASDHIDSDASIVSTNAEIDIMTGDWGAVNHKLDYGFTATPACTNPTVTAFAIQPSCTNNAPNLSLIHI